MGGFIVERNWPGVTETDVLAMGAALRRCESSDVTFLGSILVPEDEVVLFRFDATSALHVEAVGGRAGLRCDRVVVAVFNSRPDQS
jgi:hypothetical protein